MKNIVAAIIVAAIFLFSCTKKKSEEPKAQVFKSSLKTCACSESKAGDFKIEATIDGKQICFDKLWHPNSVTLDKWIQNSWRSDILIERLSSDSSAAIRIEYQFPRFDSTSLPSYQFDSTHHGFVKVF